MKKFFLIIPVCGLTLSVLSGCRKMVTVAQPYTSLTTSEVFNSDATAGVALTSIYAYMISNSSNTWTNGGTVLLGGLSSDELVCYRGPLDGNYVFQTNQLVASAPGTTVTNNAGAVDGDIWAPAYKEIYYANAVISGVAASTSEQLTDSARKQLTGEAKFIRAFCYFYLTNLFGDVPMPLSTDFNATSLLPKSPQAAVYAQIVADLQDAQGLLPDNFNAGGGERIRPNKAAAAALLARVDLYQQNYPGADSLASSVIANNQYALTSQLNTTFNANSPEAIWQLVPDIVSGPYTAYEDLYFEPSQIWLNVVPPAYASVFLDSTFYSQYGATFAGPYYLSNNTGNAFEPGDLRKANWTGYTPTPSSAPWYGDTLWWPYKYQHGTEGAKPTQYVMMLRLAEQYLIRAEAKVKEGDLAAAAADINTIRTRAGLANTTATNASDLLAAIAQERRVELFAEFGDRWLDLKRTNTAAATLDTISYKRWSNTQLLYPIPVNEIIDDPNLKQNTGY